VTDRRPRARPAPAALRAGRRSTTPALTYGRATAGRHPAEGHESPDAERLGGGNGGTPGFGVGERVSWHESPVGATGAYPGGGGGVYAEGVNDRGGSADLDALGARYGVSAGVLADLAARRRAGAHDDELRALLRQADRGGLGAEEARALVDELPR
jgi:hypothetical protein